MLRKLSFLAAIPALVIAGYWSLRLAWADHLSRSIDPQTVARAAALSPGDADIRLKLAAVQQAAGIDPAPALEAAARLDPMDANAWIHLGVASEIRGDLRAAENQLLEAARVSRQFAPRWALTNYYFRRGNEESFWHWAKESLAIGNSDLSPVFQLCWRMRPDAGAMERIIPDRDPVLNAYLLYCLQQGRPGAGEAAAMRLAARISNDDPATLLAWCNRQIDAGSIPAALQVWNTLCARHILRYAPLDRERAPLTDGEFATLLPHGGFAWRLTELPGVTWGRNHSPEYLWMTFSGDQPEACEPLMQFVPAAPRATYNLHFEYRTAEVPVDSGLRWTAFEARTGTELAGSAWLSSKSWKQEGLRFTAAADGLVRLSLTCRRVSGATRIAGTVDLRNLSLEREP